MYRVFNCELIYRRRTLKILSPIECFLDTCATETIRHVCINIFINISLLLAHVICRQNFPKSGSSFSQVGLSDVFSQMNELVTCEKAIEWHSFKHRSR